MATVTLDTHQLISAGYGTELRTTFTGEGDRRLLVVVTSCGGNNSVAAPEPKWSTTTSAGSVGATLSALYQSTAGLKSLGVWYAQDPATATVEVWCAQGSAPTFMHAMVWTNTDTTNPFGSAATPSTTVVSNSTAHSHTMVDGQTDGIYIGAACKRSTGAGSFTTGTELQNLYATNDPNGDARYMLSYTQPAATSDTIRWVQSAGWTFISTGFPIIAASGTIYYETPSGSITKTGALTRIALKTLAGSITKTGAIGPKVISLAGNIVGSITNTGAVAKAINLASGFVGSITNTGALALTTLKALAGSITNVGALTKIVQKALSGALALAGGITTGVRKTITFWIDDQIETDIHIKAEPANEDD